MSGLSVCHLSSLHPPIFEFICTYLSLQQKRVLLSHLSQGFTAKLTPACYRSDLITFSLGSFGRDGTEEEVVAVMCLLPYLPLVRGIECNLKYTSAQTFQSQHSLIVSALVEAVRGERLRELYLLEKVVLDSVMTSSVLASLGHHSHLESLTLLGDEKGHISIMFASGGREQFDQAKQKYLSSNWSAITQCHSLRVLDIDLQCGMKFSPLLLSLPSSIEQLLVQNEDKTEEKHWQQAFSNPQCLPYLKVLECGTDINVTQPLSMTVMEATGVLRPIKKLLCAVGDIIHLLPLASLRRLQIKLTSQSSVNELGSFPATTLPNLCFVDLSVSDDSVQQVDVTPLFHFLQHRPLFRLEIKGKARPLSEECASILASMQQLQHLSIQNHGYPATAGLFACPSIAHLFPAGGLAGLMSLVLFQWQPCGDQLPSLLSASTGLLDLYLRNDSDVKGIDMSLLPLILHLCPRIGRIYLHEWCEQPPNPLTLSELQAAFEAHPTVNTGVGSRLISCELWCGHKFNEACFHYLLSQMKHLPQLAVFKRRSGPGLELFSQCLWRSLPHLQIMPHSARVGQMLREGSPITQWIEPPSQHRHRERPRRAKAEALTEAEWFAHIHHTAFGPDLSRDIRFKANPPNSRASFFEHLCSQLSQEEQIRLLNWDGGHYD